VEDGQKEITSTSRWWRTELLLRLGLLAFHHLVVDLVKVHLKDTFNDGGALKRHKRKPCMQTRTRPVRYLYGHKKYVVQNVIFRSSKVINFVQI